MSPELLGDNVQSYNRLRMLLVGDFAFDTYRYELVRSPSTSVTF